MSGSVLVVGSSPEPCSTSGLISLKRGCWDTSAVRVLQLQNSQFLPIYLEFTHWWAGKGCFLLKDKSTDQHFIYIMKDALPVAKD